MKYIDADKLYEYLEQVSEFYPRYADNFLDNAVINVINGIKTFIASLQQEQPEVDLEGELDKYLRGDFRQTAGGNFNNYIQVARHFFELGLNARKHG